MNHTPARPVEVESATPQPGHEPADYRIAFFTNTYRPFVGGVALSVELFQRHLDLLGDHVTVYAPEYGEESADEGLDVQRMPAIRHFNDTDWSLPLPVSFRPSQDDELAPYDIVHVHHPFLLGEMGMRLARQRRLPLVFTYHTQYEQYTHYVPINGEQAARTIVRHAAEFCNLCDLILAPTHDIRRMLEQRGVESWIEVLPTGIEMDRFARADRASLRRELKIGPHDPLLVHVGRLAEEKNLLFLMEACLEALARLPAAHLVIAGQGVLADELEQMTRDAGEPGRRVHLVGVRTGQSLIDLYGASDLFVFASKTETQGMVIAEAMAAGSPVLALDADGVRDLIRDDINGRLLPGNTDPAGFAAAILDAFQHPDRLAGWRAESLSAARLLDMPLQAARLHELYRRLKLLPAHRLKDETLSFGLIRNYFETIWEDVGRWFEQI